MGDVMNALVSQACNALDRGQGTAVGAWAELLFQRNSLLDIGENYVNNRIVGHRLAVCGRAVVTGPRRVSESGQSAE